MAPETRQRPGYTLTRKAFWVSFVLAWLVIAAILAGALFERREMVALADIVVPSMVVLIASTLGIHRGFGAIDMRTMYRSRRVSRDDAPTENEVA